MEKPQSLHDYLKKGISIIFFATIFVSSTGLILDAFNFRSVSSFMVINNMIALAIILITCLLYLFSLLQLNISFTIMVYVLLGNIILAYLSIFFGANLIHFFLRDSIFVIYLITIASLAINKRHGFIISFLYLVFATIFTWVTKEPFLEQIFLLQILLFLAYVGTIYYFMDLFEKLLYNQAENNKKILEQNETVQEANALLEEKQQLVEKQAQELKNQKEILLQTNHELKETVATKDRFFSILAHDLRNPISTLIGFTELLYRNEIGFEDSQWKSITKALYESSINTCKLLDNLLIWSRMQTSQIKTKFETVSIYNLIMESCKLYTNMQRNKNIDIELQVNKDQEIYADKFMIASAINNLLSNAIKFTPVGGTIKISTTLTDSDYVQVCISDNGIGIPPEDIAKLFRIDQSHTTIGTNNEKGSGLGLLLCKEFVEQNEGKIWVNSEPGKGSQFFFTVKGIG